MVEKTPPTGGNGSAPIVPSDGQDLADLWLDTKMGDGIVSSSINTVPVGKPKAFFRVHPDQAYRRRCEVFVHKNEGQIEETNYIVGPEMRGLIGEARPCTIVTCIYRDGTVRLWPIRFPREGEHDNDAWISARAAAKVALEKWIRIVWVRRSYEWRYAAPGYAPDPNYAALPPFDTLVRLGFGVNGIIRGKVHPIYCELMGERPAGPSDAADL
jgi:hypothetical protein